MSEANDVPRPVEPMEVCPSRPRLAGGKAQSGEGEVNNHVNAPGSVRVDTVEGADAFFAERFGQFVAQSC